MTFRYEQDDQEDLRAMLARIKRKKINSLFKADAKLEKQYFLKGIFKYKLSHIVRPGEYFGEQALRSYKPRARTMMAAETVELLSLSKEDFFNAAAELIASMKEKTEFLIKALPHEENPEQVEMLSYHFSELTTKNKQILYLQEDEPNALYYVKSGSVVLTYNLETKQKQDSKKQISIKGNFKNHSKSSSYDSTTISSSPTCFSNGKSCVNVAALTEGEFFGEELILGTHNRQFSATVSSSETVLYKLSKFSYSRIQTQYERIFEMIKKLALFKNGWRLERMKKPTNTEKEIEIKNELNRRYSKLPPANTPALEHLKALIVETDKVQQNKNLHALKFQRKRNSSQPNLTETTRMTQNSPGKSDNLEMLQIKDAYKNNYQRKVYESSVTLKETGSGFLSPDRSLSELFRPQKRSTILPPLTDSTITPSSLQAVSYERFHDQKEDHFQSSVSLAVSRLEKSPNLSRFLVKENSSCIAVTTQISGNKSSFINYSDLVQTFELSPAPEKHLEPVSKLDNFQRSHEKIRKQTFSHSVTLNSGNNKSVRNIRSQLRGILRTLEDDPSYLDSPSKDKALHFLLSHGESPKLPETRFLQNNFITQNLSGFSLANSPNRKVHLPTLTRNKSNSRSIKQERVVQQHKSALSSLLSQSIYKYETSHKCT